MAISKTVNTPQGFVADNAYIRVENVCLVTKSQIQFNVRSYKTIQNPFFSEIILSCAYDITKTNPIEQAYDYLKTLDAFIGARDC